MYTWQTGGDQTAKPGVPLGEEPQTRNQRGFLQDNVAAFLTIKTERARSPTLALLEIHSATQDKGATSDARLPRSQMLLHALAVNVQ